MMNSRKIAILLATYNGEKYLKEQLDSLIRQSYNNWMLYIHDDGSNDKTLEIINSYIGKDSRIVLIDGEKKHLGPGQAFMSLLEAVDSELYMFCDQDDVWLPDKIEKTLNSYMIIGSHTDIPVVVHTDVSVVDENLNVMAKSYWRDINMNPDRINTFNYICVCCYTNGNTMLFNKRAKELCFPIIDNIIMHDKYVSSRVLKNGGIVLAIHEPLVLYRQHGLNVCGFTVGHQNAIISRLRCLPSVLKSNFLGYRELKDYGFGSIFKYIWYKFLVEFSLHFMKNF